MNRGELLRKLPTLGPLDRYDVAAIVGWPLAEAEAELNREIRAGRIKRNPPSSGSVVFYRVTKPEWQRLPMPSQPMSVFSLAHHIEEQAA